MSTTPYRLQTGLSFDQAIPLLNGNFDNAASDLRDFGSNTSTTVTIPITVAASSVAGQTVVLLSQENVSNHSPFIIRTQKPVARVATAQYFADVYVDAQDIQHNWFQGSLSNGQLNFIININNSNTTYNNSLAAWTINILNRDSVQHVYYISIGCWYIPLTSGSILQ